MKVAQKVKRLNFVDSLSGMDRYLADNKKGLFIAMSPRVYSYLKEKGFLVQNTLPYFTNDSHRRTLEKTQVLTDWLRENFHLAEPHLGIEQALRDSFIYWARIPINYCLWVIEIVCNAAEIHQPEELSAPLSNQRLAFSVNTRPEEGYLSSIVKIIAQKKRLKCEDPSGKLPQALAFATKNLIYSLGTILKYAGFKSWVKLISVKIAFTKSRPILFTTGSYQMDKLAEEVQAHYRHNRFYFLPKPIIPSFGISAFMIRFFQRKQPETSIFQKELLKNLVTAFKKDSELFSFRDISFCKVILAKIKNDISHYIAGLHLWSSIIAQSLDRLRPYAIISNGSRPDDFVLAELCRKKEIPALLISHGSHISPKNRYEQIEWGEHGRALLRAPFSYLALQSPVAEGYLDSFPSSSNIIKTGPLLWGRPADFNKSKILFKKMFNTELDTRRKKVVLHAGTPKGRAFRFYVYETPYEYLQALTELAGAVQRISDTVLIIKFRPSREISIEDLKTFVPLSEKVILSVDEPFNEVLGMSDLLVSFSSTTIEEALQNRIPVLLYGGGGRYEHLSAYQVKPDGPLGRSAVYYVKVAADLEYAIREILNLDMDRNKDGHLFDPYIYPKDARTSLDDLLKLWLKEKRFVE